MVQASKRPCFKSKVDSILRNTSQLTSGLHIRLHTHERAHTHTQVLELVAPIHHENVRSTGVVLRVGGLDAEQACGCGGGPSASLIKLQVIAPRACS